MNASTALGAYKTNKNDVLIDDATPHRLIAMLLDGAIEHVISAAGAMQRGEVAVTGESIGKAISIVDNLRVSLDQQQGGEIAENLASLYEYMTRRLLEANATKDSAMLAEVAGLLKEIKAAWDQVPTDLHHASE
jgi:flagellar secretion chaperone FliS